MGPKNSYKCDLTNLLVTLIMLSYNPQNHKQWPNRTMFLHNQLNLLFFYLSALQLLQTNEILHEEDAAFRHGCARS